MSSHVENAESPHEQRGECLLPIPISKSVQSNSVPKLVVARNVFSSLESSVFWFSCRKVTDDAFHGER